MGSTMSEMLNTASSLTGVAITVISVFVYSYFFGEKMGKIALQLNDITSTLNDYITRKEHDIHITNINNKFISIEKSIEKIERRLDQRHEK